MPKEFFLTSSAFENQGIIPDKFSAHGENISPQLSWSNVPEDTEQLILIMDDPDATRGVYMHWIVSIPKDIGFLPENAGRQTNYFGPKPPIGHAQHRYRFFLFAMNANYKDWPIEYITSDDFRKTYHNCILGEAQLMGFYEKKDLALNDTPNQPAAAGPSF